MEINVDDAQNAAIFLLALSNVIHVWVHIKFPKVDRVK